MEIYWSGTWGSIRDSSWTTAEASVVCRQLQHSDKGISSQQFIIVPIQKVIIKALGVFSLSYMIIMKCRSRLPQN